MTSEQFDQLTDSQRNALVLYLLELGDDQLILGHRLSEWCGHGPMLEEDIALTNIALDCIGGAQFLLEQAGRVEGKNRSGDDLAFFREAVSFRNCMLVEQPNGDFAHTITRQFFFDAFSCLLFEKLSESSFAPLAAIAEKLIKEARYHLRHSSSWVIRLGDGTDQSHQRMIEAVETLAPFTAELFQPSKAAQILCPAGIAVDCRDIKEAWFAITQQVLGEATLPPLPDKFKIAPWGREGAHSELLGHLLSQMQITARSFPGASW